ncbi:MAG: hypothetical protein LBU42_09590, partial [Prevotellaceae bacterium]|nr:hypothetical protein [Prevotellaceae bacterium]
MATIQVDDIQVAKSGQWHSLRGQKIAQDSQWKTFDTGCGVAKSGDWYVLKEQGYQVELLLTTKPDDMGNLVVYPTVLLNKPLEEDAEITVSFRQDIEPGQEITIYGLAGETVLYSYDYCIIYSSGFYDSLNVRQVEIEWSEPHTVVKRAMKTGYLYDDVIARTLFGIPIASTEDVSFDITTENDEYFEGIVTISAGSCFKITNYNLDYKEYNIANIVPGSIT